MREVTCVINTNNLRLFDSNLIRKGENLATKLNVVLSEDYLGYKYKLKLQLNSLTAIETAELTLDEYNTLTYLISSSLTSEVGKLVVQLNCYNDTGLLLKELVTVLQVKNAI